MVCFEIFICDCFPRSKKIGNRSFLYLNFGTVTSLLICLRKRIKKEKKKAFCMKCILYVVPNKTAAMSFFLKKE